MISSQQIARSVRVRMYTQDTAVHIALIQNIILYLPERKAEESQEDRSKTVGIEGHRLESPR